MRLQPALSKTSDHRKSVTVVLSKSTRSSRRGGLNLEGAEETEIHAQVHVPEEGCWGWVVVAAAFCIIFIMDGVVYTFGSIRSDLSSDIDISETKAALVNSIACALYLMAAPLASAFINRFGFRACAMAGSIICALSLFTCYFITNYGPLCVFYGFFTGIGYAFLNMSAGLIVGFYFEKMRSVAISIVMVGSSFGIMGFYPINTYLVNLAGWRSVTLLHSGMFGCSYFIAMAFQPLLQLEVIKTQAKNDQTHTVTYLPNLSAATVKDQGPRSDTITPTKTERLFAAVENDNFPTAADVVQQDNEPTFLSTQPGTSAGTTNKPVSKLTITAITSKSGISQHHLQQVKSIMSKSNVTTKDGHPKNLEMNIPVQEPKSKSCWGRLCHWEEHVPESRPMYRDDAFYDGKIENLPAYQKSKAAVAAHPEAETGLEYQLAVSRAAAAQDLQENRGVFTTAVRRVLATMMDPKLLKRRSFQLMSVSGFLVCLGFYVPYMYIQDRNLEAGMEPTSASFLVSAMSGTNAFGRLILGVLAAKFDPTTLTTITYCFAGSATALVSVSNQVYFQYFCSCVYGFGISSVAGLRALVVVQHYGLERLTNAVGMILLVQGLATLSSAPLAASLKERFGYTVAFSAAGTFIILAGVLLATVNSLSLKENDLTLLETKKLDGSNKLVSSKK